jgi:hypothetical protein
MKTIFSIVAGIMLAGLIQTKCIAQISAPEIEWQQSFGGNSWDYLYGVQQTTDGGYILGGYSQSGISGNKTEASLAGDFWVLKLNTLGTIEWQNAIGGSDYDGVHCLQQTSDGGYILGGFSKSGISGDKTEPNQGISSTDYWVVKLNSTGSIEWQNTIGGNDYDYLESIQQTTDGGYILGGYSYSGLSGDKTSASFGSVDYWVLKLNVTGAIEWQRTIGGSDADYLHSVQQTADGGYILGGSSNSGISGNKTEASKGNYDYWLLKLNATGAIEWQHTIGGNDIDYLFAARQTSDNGFVLGGYSYSGISGDKTEVAQGGYDYWVVKTDAEGMITWQNTIGGGSDDRLYDIQQTSDNGYLLGGYSKSGISGDKTEPNQGFLTVDYWVAKLNVAGELEWQNTIGGSKDDYLHSVQQTSDGGFILGGWSESGITGDKTAAYYGNYDNWLVKLSATDCGIPTGTFTSAITLNSAKTNWNTVTNANKYQVRYRLSGTTTWIKVSSSVNNKKLKNLSAGTQYEWQVQSNCTALGLGKSAWSETVTFTTNPVRLSFAEETVFQVYPNPAGEFIIFDLNSFATSQVEIFIYNTSGVLLKQITASHSTHLQIPVDDIGSDGMYFYTVRTSDKQFFAGKFIIQR